MSQIVGFGPSIKDLLDKIEEQQRKQKKIITLTITLDSVIIILLIFLVTKIVN